MKALVTGFALLAMTASAHADAWALFTVDMQGGNDLFMPARMFNKIFPDATSCAYEQGELVAKLGDKINTHVRTLCVFVPGIDTSGK